MQPCYLRVASWNSSPIARFGCCLMGLVLGGLILVGQVEVGRAEAAGRVEVEEPPQTATPQTATPLSDRSATQKPALEPIQEPAPAPRQSPAKNLTNVPDLKAEPLSSPASAQRRASARELSKAFRDAAARTLPSVVRVKVRTRAIEAEGVVNIVGGNDSTFDGVGSGVIVTAEGLILTNNHVVKDAKRIEVALLDGRQFEARDVKADPSSDLALLRIDAPDDLPAAAIGDSQLLEVGDWVLAIGSPFGIDSTVSAGIISGKNRKLSDLVNGRFLQTDAAINPGNSGGALIDLDGQLVGINTAISSNSGTYQGIGFAIPIHRAMWVKNELITRGRVRQARIGASVNSLPLDIAKQLQLSASGGAYVVSVASGRPASKAGLLPGDIIVSFDHQHVSDNAELKELVNLSPIDQPLEMIIVRGGEKKTLSITLEAVD